MSARRLIVPVLALAAIAFVIVPTAAQGQTTHRCDGRVATIVGTSVAFTTYVRASARLLLILRSGTLAPGSRSTSARPGCCTGWG